MDQLEAIFVITICEKRWSKYDESIYTKFPGCDGQKELSLDDVKKNNINYPNCSDSRRLNSAGATESHRRMMKHIIDNKLNKVVVIEDDAFVDTDRLSELKGVDHFCYIGGRFQPLNLRKTPNRGFRTTICPQTGMNEIKGDLTITGAHGLYFPTWEIAQEIYQSIFSKPRIRIIDGELRLLQKKHTSVKHYIYPAISTLYMPDAIQGFTFEKKSNYHLCDNNSHY